MKVKTYKNARGKLSTDGFDPDEDGYDPIEEEQRELYEQEARDDYMSVYQELDEPDDDIVDDAGAYDYEDDDPGYYDDPYDLYGCNYPDE